MIIVVILLISVPFLVRMSAASRSTERGARALTAFNLAEAGIDKVMWELNPWRSLPTADPDPIVWDLSGLNAVGLITGLTASDGQTEGDVQVVLTTPVGTAPNPRTRSLTATGMVPFIAGNTVNRTVRVDLQQDYKSIFEVGFFVDEFFFIRNGFLLDAYDSRDGAYGAALAGGGTNSLLPDVYFGSNSYMDDARPRDPGDATWVINQGGGSNEVYGTVMAGGDAAEAYLNDQDGDPTTNPPPDPSLLESVISVPSEDIFMGSEDRLLMTQEYELPPVDVYNLPPKEILGSIPAVGDWFYGYDSTTPESSQGYYFDRIIRAPRQAEIEGYFMSTFSTAANGSGLTPANNGVYTSFRIGDYGTSGTLNISGGDVVIYVTTLGDTPAADGNAASFYMGKNSSINIAPDSSLTLILGNASMTAEQGYSINAQGNPAQAANCVILGTDQFTLPQNPKFNFDKAGVKIDDVDKSHTPGLMFFEHGQGGEPNGQIYAATYAPGAHLTTGQGQNHMDYYGALITKSMDFKVQVDFHYDKALADLKIVTGGYEYWKIINWVELVGGN